jgi:hypothetical protein
MRLREVRLFIPLHSIMINRILGRLKDAATARHTRTPAGPTRQGHAAQLLVPRLSMYPTSEAPR